MKDFFINYNIADKAWGEWLSWQLQKKGYRVFTKSWEDRPDNRFLTAMQNSIAQARHTIVLLSPDYLEVEFAHSKWLSTFSRLPQSSKQAIRIRKSQHTGLLSTIDYIDWVDIDETTALKTLFEKIALKEAASGASGASAPSFSARLHPPYRYPGKLPAIWNIPFLRNSHFTGRGTLLSQLRDTLKKSNIALLTQQATQAFGGIGKTQIALEYCYRFHSKYDTVWWLRSTDPITLAVDYTEMANPLNLSEKNASKQTITIEAVRRWLGKNHNWLLIFDGALNYKDICQYLSHFHTGHIIITSRQPDWREIENLLEISPFTRQASIDFLCKKTNDHDQIAANALATALGDLPLSLELAGTYIARKKICISDYLEIFREHQAALLQQQFFSGEHLDTLATTWDLTFQELRKISPAAVELLNLLAFFAPDNIPQILVKQTRKYLSRDLENEHPLLDIDPQLLNTLNHYAFTFNNNNNHVSMHPLIQELTRERLEQDEQKYRAEIAINTINDLFPKNNHNLSSWSECNKLISHARAALDHADQFKILSQKTAHLIHQIGRYLNSRAVYREAEKFYRLTIERIEVLFSANHPELVNSLNNLAGLLKFQGRYPEAETIIRRILNIHESQPSPDHSKIFHSLNKLAGLLKTQGKLSEAEALYRRVLTSREEKLGMDHPKVEKTLTKLAGILKAQGQYSEAEPFIKRLIQIKENTFGPTHPEVASSLNSLALLFQAQDKLTEAEPLIRRVLKIRENQLGSNHPYAIQARNNLNSLLEQIQILPRKKKS